MNGRKPRKQTGEHGEREHADDTDQLGDFRCRDDGHDVTGAIATTKNKNNRNGNTRESISFAGVTATYITSKQGGGRHTDDYARACARLPTDTHPMPPDA